MPENFRPIKFSNLLPEIFRSLNGDEKEESHIEKLLKPYEDLFEELFTSIEGKVYHTKLLSVNRVDMESEICLCVEMTSDNFLSIFNINSEIADYHEYIQDYYISKGYVTVSGVLESTSSNVVKFDASNEFLSLTIKSNHYFIENIFPGSIIMLRIGEGISDLFNPLRLETVLNEETEEQGTKQKTLYENQFPQSPKDGEMQRLKYIAGWLCLPLRDDKKAWWNRRFINNVLKYTERTPSVWRRRSTLVGLTELLKEWLRDDVEEASKTYPIIVSDMTRPSNFAPSAFMIREKVEDYRNDEIIPPTIGVNTVLGEGVPYYFVIDILLKNMKVQSHCIKDILGIFNSIKFLISMEKPAYTQCHLTLRTYTMSLAPRGFEKAMPSYAQIGQTTLLWKNHITIKL